MSKLGSCSFVTTYGFILINIISLIYIFYWSILIIDDNFKPNIHNSSTISFVVIPDTQYYSAYHPDTFISQTKWIVNCKDEDEISFVIHLGDVVEHGNQIPYEWAKASYAMKYILDSNIPFSIVPGNHDRDPENGNYNYSMYEKFVKTYNYRGTIFDNTKRNSYLLIDIPVKTPKYKATIQFLLLSIEMNPTSPDDSNNLFNWADSILKKYPNRIVILTSHFVLSDCSDVIANMIQQLSFHNCNVFMAIGGHLFSCGGENTITENNECGSKTMFVVVDYQERFKGGNGWLRYFTILLDEETPKIKSICAETYSTITGQIEIDNNSNYLIDFQNDKEDFGVCNYNTCKRHPLSSTLLLVNLTFAFLIILYFGF